MRNSLDLATVPGNLIADEDLHSLHLYSLDITGVSLFRHRHAEWEAGQRAQKGDHQARNELVVKNLRFAATIARRYRHQPLPSEDLLAAANKGLIHAADRFDPNQNVKFISYAVYWIRQQINAALANQAFTVRLPLNVYQSVYRSHSHALTADAFATPSRPNVSNHGVDQIDNVSRSKAIDVLRAATPPIQLQHTTPNNPAYLENNREDDNPDLETDPDHAYDQLRVETHETKCLTKISYSRLHALMSALLTDREHNILLLYYGFDGPTYTLEDIGDEFDVTRERIRQLRNRALTKIFDHPQGKAIGKDYRGGNCEPTGLIRSAD